LFLRMGWTVLAITYRGDVGAPANHPPGYRLGETEWRDLEAAVRYALEHGAQRVEIIGLSMGGAITLEFLRHSPLAPRVMGVVFEAPVLEWRPVFDLAARHRGVPAAVTSLGMSVAAWRAGLDWSELDQLAHANDLHTPILILHGDADPTVPLATSDSLAARRPDLVTLVKVISAGHSRCRNVDPLGYDAAVASWTRSRLAASAAATARPGAAVVH
jgi:pimeloyl-ACP methyl ester carboxylesterase